MRNLTKKPRGKSESPVKTIVVGVIIALAAGGSSPWWWGVIFPHRPVKVVCPECYVDVLRNQMFRAGPDKSAFIRVTARDMKHLFDQGEVKCVRDLATVLLEQDRDNGHGLYFQGETWRAEANDPMQRSYAREKMQEYFLKYIANERDLLLSERGGDGKVCYEREKGYCAERTAWINHLMAIEYYHLAGDSKDTTAKKNLLEGAEKFLRIDLGFNGGFLDIIPSEVLKNKIEGELQSLRASHPKDL